MKNRETAMLWEIALGQLAEVQKTSLVFKVLFEVAAANLALAVPNWLLLMNVPGTVQSYRQSDGQETEIQGRVRGFSEDGRRAVFLYPLTETPAAVNGKDLSYAILKSGLVTHWKSMDFLNARIRAIDYDRSSNTLRLAPWRIDPGETGRLLCAALAERCAFQAWPEDAEAIFRALGWLIAEALPVQDLQMKGRDVQLNVYWESQLAGADALTALGALDRLRRLAVQQILTLRRCLPCPKEG